jgi:hypothetical protein
MKSMAGGGHAAVVVPRVLLPIRPLRETRDKPHAEDAVQHPSGADLMNLHFGRKFSDKLLIDEFWKFSFPKNTDTHLYDNYVFDLMAKSHTILFS